MPQKNRLSIVLTFVAGLYLLNFGLVILTLAVCKHLPTDQNLTIYFCAWLLGFVAIGFLTRKTRFFEKELNRKRLNRVVIPFSFLGPLFFFCGIYYLFRESDLLSSIFTCILEPLSIVATIMFLITNTKHCSKTFLRFGVPLFVILTAVNLYCFVPFGYVFQRVFDIQIYDWAAKMLYVIMSL